MYYYEDEVAMKYFKFLDFLSYYIICIVKGMDFCFLLLPLGVDKRNFFFLSVFIYLYV